MRHAGCKDYQTLTRVERGHWALTGWKGIEVAPSRLNHWFVPDAPRVEGAFLTASVSTSKTFSSWNRNQLATRLVCCQSSKIFSIPWFLTYMMISMCLHFPSYLDVASFDPSGPAQILQESHGSTNHLQYGQHVPALPLVSPGFSWIFTQIMFRNMAKLVLRIFPSFVGPQCGGPKRCPGAGGERLAAACPGCGWGWSSWSGRGAPVGWGVLFVHCLKHIFEARFSEFWKGCWRLRQ